jgi:hypothetical protein
VVVGTTVVVVVDVDVVDDVEVVEVVDVVVVGPVDGGDVEPEPDVVSTT